MAHEVSHELYGGGTLQEANQIHLTFEITAILITLKSTIILSRHRFRLNNQEESTMMARALSIVWMMIVSYASDQCYNVCNDVWNGHHDGRLEAEFLWCKESGYYDLKCIIHDGNPTRSKPTAEDDHGPKALMESRRIRRIQRDSMLPPPSEFPLKPDPPNSRPRPIHRTRNKEAERRMKSSVCRYKSLRRQREAMQDRIAASTRTPKISRDDYLRRQAEKAVNSKGKATEHHRDVTFDSDPADSAGQTELMSPVSTRPRQIPPENLAAIKKKMMTARGNFESSDVSQRAQVTVYWMEIKSNIADPYRYNNNLWNIMEENHNDIMIAPFIEESYKSQKLNLKSSLTDYHRVLIELRGFLNEKHLSELHPNRKLEIHQANLESIMSLFRQRFPDGTVFKRIFDQFIEFEKKSPFPSFAKKQSQSQLKLRDYLKQFADPNSRKINLNLSQYRNEDHMLLLQSLYRFFHVVTTSMIRLLGDEAQSIFDTKILPKLRKLDSESSTVNEMLGAQPEMSDIQSVYNAVLNPINLHLKKMESLLEDGFARDAGFKIFCVKRMCKEAVELEAILQDISNYHTTLVTINELLDWRLGESKRNMTIIRHGKDWGSPLMNKLVNFIAREGHLDINERKRESSNGGNIQSIYEWIQWLVAADSWMKTLILISQFVFFVHLLVWCFET